MYIKAYLKLGDYFNCLMSILLKKDLQWNNLAYHYKDFVKENKY